MRDSDLQSKLEMAKTLHAYGVELACISVATGLTRAKLLSKLKIADESECRKLTIAFSSFSEFRGSDWLTAEGEICSISATFEILPTL